MKELFKDLHLNDISFKQTKRLKSKDDKQGPIIVEKNNLVDCLLVLKASKIIKSSKLNIFINKDLTDEELILEKNFRKERNERNKELEHANGDLKYGYFKFANSNKADKFYWGIRNGELKRIRIIENYVEMPNVE